MPETAYPKKTHLQAKMAAAIRDHKPQSEIDDLRRAFRAAKIAEFVADQVALAPRLTPEQADRITALLRPGGDAA